MGGHFRPPPALERDGNLVVPSESSGSLGVSLLCRAQETREKPKGHCVETRKGTWKRGKRSHGRAVKTHTHTQCLQIQFKKIMFVALYVNLWESLLATSKPPPNKSKNTCFFLRPSKSWFQGTPPPSQKTHTLLYK